jgi:large repetitive protein
VGGTVSNLLEVNSTTYMAMFTGSADTSTNNASVSVTAGSWQDGNGVAGAGGSTAPFTVDTVVPTVSVSVDNTVLNAAHPSALVTFTFSKPPTDFSLNDVRAVDGTLSNLSGSGTTYAAAFTAHPGVEDNAATINVIDGSYHDIDGNAGSGGSTVSPVTFSSAVATFYEVQNNWAPSQMIDGIFTGPPPVTHRYAGVPPRCPLPTRKPNVGNDE